MMPLLAAFETFHSNLRSKFSNSSSVTISPPLLICQSFFTAVSRKRAPSATFHAEPTGPPPYLCQPFVVLPSNNDCHSSSIAFGASFLFSVDFFEGLQPATTRNRQIRKKNCFIYVSLMREYIIRLPQHQS